MIFESELRKYLKCQKNKSYNRSPFVSWKNRSYFNPTSYL